ncbi:uncharacterized protein FOMMEDRAFT_162592 [Fomitiporia mediterranea MF3/22]|uniref:Uncharacterized protein n=1 Tax=Fomitiporia mediterranea (strain MF3/22) TaxID=694068 RepID=R7SHM8_FOMME|nr:uncharacterized protein FOMMEDRAFT_162592 [Fomitiporia mediterranea MF3/22]EJC97772.1 hypothetical protein FOMMEDRAFT_162592 [Fomitiporia mediterranea MF3/22]
MSNVSTSFLSFPYLWSLAELRDFPRRPYLEPASASFSRPGAPLGHWVMFPAQDPDPHVLFNRDYLPVTTWLTEFTDLTYLTALNGTCLIYEIDIPERSYFWFK